MSRLTLAISALSVAGFVASTPAVAGPRAFVASTGNDANTASSCAPTTPCRSFTAALTVVDAGGEIVALDAAGYGAITITKSVSIIANPGFYAGISASTGNAVTIATANVNVVLRGLNINGTGAGYGINMTSGASLVVENCAVSNFAATGMYVGTPAKVRVADTVVRTSGDGIWAENGAKLDVTRSRLINNDVGVFARAYPASTTTTAAVSDSVASGNGVGFLVYDDAAATARMSVTRSTASQNDYGFFAQTSSGGTITLSVSNVMATGNVLGFVNNNNATFESLGNNLVRQNGTNVSGTITTVAGI